MKRRLFVVLLLLVALILLLWLLAPSPPGPAIAAKFLYRTNWPGGRVRYVIAVTNVSRAPVEVKMTNALLVSIGPTFAGTNQISFDFFRLGGGEDVVLAWASTNSSPRTADLVYSRRPPVSAWRILLHKATGATRGKPTERFPDPQIVSAPIPPE